MLESDISLGAKVIKFGDGEKGFISEIESYAHRGGNFESFTPIEFECVIDIQKSI